MRKVRVRRLPFPLVWLAFTSLLYAQGPQAALPAVTFTCDFPGSDPSHYTISISSDGHGSYASDGKFTRQSESTADAPDRLEFRLSQAMSAHIFDLAKRAHYFQGEVDSGRKHLASTGTKTLSYRDAANDTQATYNYSAIPAVQDLTEFFQNFSATLEFGRRIEYEYRFQKLALDDELKRMEQMQKLGSLADLSAIAPTLQKLLSDSSVMNVVRERAQRLLALASAGK